MYTALVLDTYTRLEGEADLAGDVREGIEGDVAGDLAGEVGGGDEGQRCQYQC